MEAVKSAHRASLRLSRCNEREWNELSIRLFSAVIFSEWLRELFQHFVSGSSWRRINIWKRGKELMTLNEAVRRRYLKTRTNKTKTISISPLKSPGSKMKPAEQKEETHTHFLHDEHQLLNMSHRQRQLTHVHVTHSAWFGSIQLFVEGVGGRRSGESNNKRAGDGRNSCSVSWPNNSQPAFHSAVLHTLTTNESLTFIRTDSLSFSLLTIFMATFWHVTQWMPSFTRPETQTEEHQHQTIHSNSFWFTLRG